MNRACRNESCFSDTACALGHYDRKDCEHWQPQEVKEGEPAKHSDVPPSDIPWNGYALGMNDLAILGGRGQPLVVGLIGPPDSGKTSLLAFLYMWLLGRGTLGDWTFAGSWTLGGWESVVQHCRWTGEPPPSFPPHTSSAGRHPGVLHIALRHRESDCMRDVMFTDAPGVWFTPWARAPAHPTAAGARWVIDHADVFLLLLDSAALADPAKLPQARRASRDLIERVGAHRGRRPVLVVWTKDDLAVPEPARNALERARGELLPDAVTFRTTVENSGSIEHCFVEAIRAAAATEAATGVVEPTLSTDPFLAFRGIHVDA